MYDTPSLEEQMAAKGCLSQSTAARALGVHPSTVHRWMNDGSVKTLEAGESKRFVEVHSLLKHFGFEAANKLGVGAKLRALGVPVEHLTGLTDEDGNPIQ